MKTLIRRILVPLDPSDYATAAAETACHVAWIHDSVVSGLAVLDSEEIRSSVIPASGPYYPKMNERVENKIFHAKHILSGCLERFEKICSEADVEYYKTEYAGMPVQKLLESAIFFDLVVTGLETSFHFATRETNGNSLTELLDRSTTPVLAVPSKAVEKFDFALITFDGSLASARAMQDFASFAVPFDMEVTVLVAEKEPEQAKFLLKNAGAFLRSHGIGRVKLESVNSPIESAVDDDYLKMFDVVVAGIHSRKLLKDFFVGSFTKSLIQRKKKALFLSH